MITSRSFRLLGTLVLGVVLATASLHAPLAHAESVTVVPPKFELVANPGDHITEDLRVGNPGSADVIFQTDAEDFVASGDQGGVSFIEDANAPKSTFSLAKWVTIEPSQFTVAAGGERVIHVNIVVPKDGEPGSHFASVQIKLAQSGPPAAGSAAVESKINSLILLRVTGAVTEKITLENFSTSDSYFQHGPIDFTLKTKNEGNVHLAPKGTIVITDMFGRKVKEIPLKEANVLPLSERSVKTTWEDTNMIGRYTATLFATYGTDKVPLNASTSFIVLPVPIIIILLVIIFLILFFLFQRRRIRKFLHKLTSD